MSCTCCDEITRQMKEWRTKAGERSREVDDLGRRLESLKSSYNWRGEEIRRLERSLAATRGALTKAKGRIAELSVEP